MEDITKVLEVIKLPLKYDDYGQMIFDADNNLLLDVRGWGRLQYIENGEKIQDDFGKMVCTAFNEKYRK